jgi:hypothetical protein
MELPEGASQTFKAGALCVFASGYVAECGADPALITGLATRDGQNAAAGTKRQNFILAHPATLFLGYLDTSASEGAGTTAATDRGLSYGVAKNAATGKWYVDKTETSNKRVTVWDVWEQPVGGVTPAWGDIMTPVLFTIAAPYCNFTAVT